MPARSMIRRCDVVQTYGVPTPTRKLGVMAQFCPECGVRAAGHSYCSECGSDLRALNVTTAASGLPVVDAVLPVTPALPSSEDDSATRYRPSVPLSILAVFWWLVNAYPAASKLADNQHQNDIVAPLISVLFASALIAAVIRVAWIAVARRWRWREAFTSPWMWVIAGGVCIVELLGQLSRHG
jgi:hypothetical protein